MLHKPLFTQYARHSTPNTKYQFKRYSGNTEHQPTSAALAVRLVKLQLVSLFPRRRRRGNTYAYL